VFSQPIVSQNKITARDNVGQSLGQIEFQGVGTFIYELGAERALVDEGGDAILSRSGVTVDPNSFETATITSVSGVYEPMIDVGDVWRTEYSGYSVRWLTPGVSLQDNMFTPVQDYFSEFRISGSYVPEPSGLALAALTTLVGCAVGAVRRGILQHRKNQCGDAQ